jgi:hypothetical protein
VNLVVIGMAASQVDSRVSPRQKTLTRISRIIANEILISVISVIRVNLFSFPAFTVNLRTLHGAAAYPKRSAHAVPTAGGRRARQRPHGTLPRWFTAILPPSHSAMTIEEKNCIIPGQQLSMFIWLYE